MTLLACIAIVFFGSAVYNLSCAIVDVPTKKTSRMMMLSRKQQGVKAENLLDVYVTKIAGMIAPYLRIDRLKRNKLQRAIAIAGMEMTPEVYTRKSLGDRSRRGGVRPANDPYHAAFRTDPDWPCCGALVFHLLCSV